MTNDIRNARYYKTAANDVSREVSPWSCRHRHGGVAWTVAGVISISISIKEISICIRIAIVTASSIVIATEIVIIVTIIITIIIIIIVIIISERQMICAAIEALLPALTTRLLP